jgi:myo-inositol-1-phosphate synthase
MKKKSRIQGKSESKGDVVRGVLHRAKECKHSVVFEDRTGDFPVKSVYVANAFAIDADKISIALSK